MEKGNGNENGKGKGKGKGKKEEQKQQMEQQMVGSFTCDLFDPPKAPPSSSATTGVFESLFGPSSTGLGKNSPHYRTSRNHDHGNRYSNANPGNSEFMGEKKEEIKNKNPTGLWDSSIYYGGQQVYSPSTNTTTTSSNHWINKDVNEDDLNGSNWWQGSLYY